MLPVDLAAQEPCTLERCALQVDAGNALLRIFGPVDPSFVVQGNPEVARYWLNPSGRFEDLLAEDDSAQAHYARFATQDNRADALRLMSNVLVITSAIGLLARDEEGGWPVVVGSTGIGLRLVAEIPAARARSEFQRAADLYNASLTQP
jgi:hypothetical protein